MGNWMTYGRLRERNGLAWRPEGDDPYPRRTEDQRPGPAWNLLVGDLNRMERDFLEPVYPQDVSERLAARPRGSSPAEQCADATGVHVETVRTVLAYVFREQR